MDIINILALNDIQKEDIVALTPYGSRTYGINHDKSDFDFMCIVKKDVPEVQLRMENIDVNVMSDKEFREHVQNCRIDILENLFYPKPLVGQQYFSELIGLVKGIDKVKLRISVSKICSKGISYAKNLWKIGDHIKAKKNICHAYRFTLFGMQLVNSGKIYDYECANDFFKRIDETVGTGEFRETMGSFLLECKVLAKEFIKMCPMVKQKSLIDKMVSIL